jgi:hypothetical protein
MPPNSLIAYLQVCILKYNKGNKIAAMRYEHGDCGSKGIAKRWHGRMELPPEMLSGGPNSGEVIGRGQSRMHCRPYAIYKDGAELQGGHKPRRCNGCRGAGAGAAALGWLVGLSQLVLGCRGALGPLCA